MTINEDDALDIPACLDRRAKFPVAATVLVDKPQEASDLHDHVSMLHKLAEGIDGKLVLASFGEDPETGGKIMPNVLHYEIGDVDGMVTGAKKLNQQRHRNVYAAMAVFRSDLPAGKKGALDDVVAVLGLVSDFDLKDDPDAGKYAERMPLSADFVIESSQGSFQAGYVFDEPCTVDEAKPLAAQLAEFVACDHRTKDPSGVWRLPGTLNWPNKKKVTAGRPAEPTPAIKVSAWNGTVKTLVELEVSMPTPDLLTDQTPRSDIAQTVVRSATKLPHDLQAIIHNGVPVGKRSEEFHHAVGWLKQLGWSAEQVIQELGRNPGGIALKYTGRLREEVERCWLKLGTAIALTAGSTDIPHSPIDWSKCVGSPPDREWTLDGMIPRGNVTSLFGDGGTGKTLLAQQLATCVATGRGDPRRSSDSAVDPVTRLFGRTVRNGPAICLFAEDDEDELWRRQADINRHYGLTMDDLTDFQAMSGFGLDNVLMSFDKAIGETTALLKRIEVMAEIAKPELIVVDNIADTFAGKEIDRVEVNQFLKVALGGLARNFGCSVLLLGHPSIHGMQSGSGFSGSTAWNNGVRSRLYIERMQKEEPDFDPDVRFLSVKKANYAAQGDADKVKWVDGVWQREEGHTGFVAHLDAKNKRRLVLKEIVRIIDSGERLSPNSRAGNDAVRRVMATDDIHKTKMRKDEIARHIDALVSDGALEVDDYKNNGKLCQQYLVTDMGRS